MNKPRNLRPLTSLRFFAAAAIVVHHSQAFGFGAGLSLRHAVSFFFMLSGFILTYVYPRLDGTGVKSFLWARFARLWPIHGITFLTSLLVLKLLHLPILPHRYGLWVMLSNFVLLQAWIPLREFNYSFNGQAWSISTELAFYLAFPLLIHQWERTWHRKLLLAVLLASGMIGLCTLLNLSRELKTTGPGLLSLLYISPASRIFEFVLGMSAALAYRRFGPAYRPTFLVGSLVELAALLLALTAVYATVAWDISFAPVNAVGQGPQSPATFWLGCAGLACGPFSVLIVVLAMQRGILARLLCLRGLVVLGESSYALYLVHVQVETVLLRVVGGSVCGCVWVAYGLYWIVALVTAYSIWRWVEGPARRGLLAIGPRVIRTQSTKPLVPIAESRSCFTTGAVLARATA